MTTRILLRLLFTILCSGTLLAAPGTPEPTKAAAAHTFLASDGLKLVGEVRGSGQTALVFLHGWCGDREYWKNQIGPFSDKYRVVAYDQAGHSASGKDRSLWTVEALAKDVESVVTSLNLKRVILIGHSMGGSIALAAAQRMPGKVVAVIGVDTLQNAEFKMPPERTQPLLDSFTKDFKSAAKTMYAALFPDGTDPALTGWVAAKAEAQDPKMATALIQDLFTLDQKPLFAKAKVPVRCINSAGGYPFFTPTAIDVNQKYADYRAVYIENVGHYPMLEKPEEFNRLLRQVLREFDDR